ncbi:MAG: glycine cleavage system aminomethyltransferase GcvT [Dehalococcoidia bacterium]|jgi:aminomethyltransferase|nr:glycine cleavage system aminomethyltransferase GcvT [Dehalococcoidia bacterium]
MPLKNKNDATALFSLHQQYEANFVEFSGFQMPLHYAPGILNEHIHTRQKCSLFDVSHMGQIDLSGMDVVKQFEALIPTDINNLAENRSVYSVLTNQYGGVIDDLIITKRNNSLRLIVNAINKSKVVDYLKKSMIDVSINLLEEYSLIALQGPMSEKILSKIFKGHEKLVFMNGLPISFNNQDFFISRSGYTGEDGFEISLPNHAVLNFVSQLLAFDDVKLAGLGARDSLRIEAGLCLYGNELSATITPVKAKLSWLITRHSSNRFPGSEIIFNELLNEPNVTKIGVTSDEKFIPRKDTVINDVSGKKIGIVSSGCFSPILQKSIALAFVEYNHAHLGNEIYFDIRGKSRPGKVVSLPFISHKYIKTNKKAS